MKPTVEEQLLRLAKTAVKDLDDIAVSLDRLAEDLKRCVPKAT